MKYIKGDILMGENKCGIFRNLYVYSIFAFALIGIIGGFFMYKSNNKPIIIGFSAQLTGRQAELGVQERNVALLAIERINEFGGIDGRAISLMIHDDLGRQQEAENGDKDLINKGVIAIIGHSTTSQTLTGLNITNAANIVMMGPTISTPKLSGLDDYFFRIHPSFEKSCQSFAKHLYYDKGVRNIGIIYDEDNLEYSKNYKDTFSEQLRDLGGNITNEVGFSSIDHQDFSELLLKLHDSKAEALLIVASDIDAALIAQKTRLMDWQIPLFASPWAQTETLISNGGKAVEGMELEQAYDLNNQSTDFNSFKYRYKERFGNEPSFGAAYSYETTLVLTEALKKTHGHKEGLKQALLDIKDFKGLTDKLSIDKFGDVQRNAYLTTINNGKFVRIEKLNSVDFGGEEVNE